MNREDYENFKRVLIDNKIKNLYPQFSELDRQKIVSMFMEKIENDDHENIVLKDTIIRFMELKKIRF